MNPGDKFEARIEKIVFGGDAFCKAPDGMAVFTANALPGELLLLEIKSVKKSFARAEILKIIEASPDRIEPVCKYAHVCCNCKYLCVNFPAENRIKHGQLKDALLREAPEYTDVLDDELVNDTEFHYRNKVEFHAHRVGNLLDLGYVKSDNVSVFDIDKCLLLNEKIQTKYDEIRSNISIMHSLRDGMELTLRYASGKDEVLFWRNSPDKKASWLKEKLSCGMFSVPLGNFFQVNINIADKLLESTAEYVDKSGAEELLDLYCGAGFFSFGCAARCSSLKRIYGVEIDERSIECAKFNLKGFENIESSFFAADSAKKLPGILKNIKDNCCVIVDPPRNGLDAKLPAMLGNTAQVKSIIYISCNLATWARDLHRLKKYGFSMKKVQGFNMFPRTGHFEIFSYWTRTK